MSGFLPSGYSAEDFIEMSEKVETWPGQLEHIRRDPGQFHHNALLPILSGFVESQRAIQDFEFFLVASQPAGTIVSIEVGDSHMSSTTAHNLMMELIFYLMGNITQVVWRETWPELPTSDWDESWLEEYPEYVSEATSLIPLDSKAKTRIEATIRRERFVYLNHIGWRPPCEEKILVTKEGIAKLIGLETSSVPGECEWGSPYLRGAGRGKKSQWDYRKILPKLRCKYPEVQFPEDPRKIISG